ncbi:MAG: hypothetical protein ACK4RF_03220 [Cyclobacteriaceae bacterium]
MKLLFIVLITLFGFILAHARGTDSKTLKQEMPKLSSKTDHCRDGNLQQKPSDILRVNQKRLKESLTHVVNNLKSEHNDKRA